MKTNLLLIITCCVAVAALAMNSYVIYTNENKITEKASPPPRIVTVDVDAVFDSHRGRQKLQQEIDAKAKTFTNEIEGLKKRSTEIAEALEKKRKTLLEIQDPEERQRQQSALVEEIKELRKFELEVARKSKDYQDQITRDSAKAAASILNEIYQLIERKSQSLGYLQVINSKALDKNGVPVVLYDHDALDFTSLLIDEVNENN